MGVGKFKLVVAVDNSLELFSRIWCVAELVESAKMDNKISLKFQSARDLEDPIKLNILKGIKVQHSQATRQDDVQMVLDKIGGERQQDMFNAFLQDLIFNHDIG